MLAIVLADLVNRHDVRVIHVRRRFRLAQETLHASTACK
jgi:hypothetical protein